MSIMPDIKVEPRLSSIVSVRQSGVRSINIENDLLSAPIADGYVLTDQARQVLERMVNRVNGGFTTRAWTLTGPYGSGKSYFGLYLMNLLATHCRRIKWPIVQLRDVDRSLAQRVQNVAGLEQTQGFLAVPVVGRRASIDDCVKNGVVLALEPHRQGPSCRQAGQRLSGQWRPPARTAGRSPHHGRRSELQGSHSCPR